MKRLFDIVCASLLLLILSPLFILVSVLVLIAMGKPIFFTQLRPGQHARPFKFFKFRSMRISTPLDDVQGNSDSQRMTRVGSFLRATSLDEIPQLINVLRGDMSLVGPRPLLMQYLDRYTPEQARRHEAKPGITGWAQVNGRNALSWEEKFTLDVWYVDNQSFSLDLKILYMTALKVFLREGISAKDSVTAPEFKGSSKDQNS